MLKIIFKHEWLGLMRNKFLLLVLFLVVGAGVYGIYYGFKTINAQKRNIAFIKEKQHEQWQKALAGFRADTTNLAGKQAYEIVASAPFARSRHSRFAIFEPTPLAALSIGQRDMFAYAIPLSAQSLYIQLFRDEITNPQKLLTGNFDLAFVLIYLFPLLIIALGYHVLSAEQEQGTFALLRLQAPSVWKIIAGKLLFYFLVVAGLVVLLSLIGFGVAGVPVTEAGSTVAVWLAALLLYNLFWVSLVWLVSALNQSSAFNAISLLGLWLFFLIILPAALNLITAVQYPVEHTHLSNIIRRTSIPNGQKGMDSVLTVYYAQNPHYQAQEGAKVKFKTAKIYAAYTELADAQSGKLVNAYQNQILTRLQALNQYQLINPAVTVQQVFNNLARTESADFIHYQQALVPYHRQVSAFFHSRIFTDKPLQPKDYDRFPEFKLAPRPVMGPDIINAFIPLTFLILLISAIAFMFYQRKFG